VIDPFQGSGAVIARWHFNACHEKNFLLVDRDGSLLYATSHINQPKHAIFRIGRSGLTGAGPLTFERTPADDRALALAPLVDMSGYTLVLTSPGEKKEQDKVVVERVTTLSFKEIPLAELAACD
jgi:hypothetical protein